MIFPSFSFFDGLSLKRYSKILDDETLCISQVKGRYIQIIKYNEAKEIILYSFLEELASQCGVAVLSSIPYNKNRFEILLPVAEALCAAYGYNTLMISSNASDKVDMYKEFGFKEVWSNLAKDCKNHASRMDVSASQELISALNLFADSIMSEIHAEEKRERNRDAYQAFADFVAEINSRSDLDSVRKAQTIHDRAAELKLD